MMDLVVNRADLLEGTEIPKLLLDLCAHVSSYEALLKQWEKGDFAKNQPIINFPGRALLEYVEQEYCRLKQEQDILLRTQRISFPTRKRNSQWRRPRSAASTLNHEVDRAEWLDELVQSKSLSGELPTTVEVKLPPRQPADTVEAKVAPCQPSTTVEVKLPPGQPPTSSLQ
jgi:hypothetical protein